MIRLAHNPASRRRRVLRSDHWPAAVVFIALLAVYADTLLPGVGGFGDTPKFQFLGHVLGVPHATGYPSYILLNHVFVRLFPWGELAWKANLLSALLAAGAGAVLFHLLRRLRCGRPVAAAGALGFGLTGAVWSQALIAEVYTLHLVLVLTVLLCLTAWRDTDRDAWLAGALLAGAVALGNHMTALFLLPVGVWSVWQRDRRVWRRSGFVAGALGGTAILVALYAYPWLRTIDPTTPFVEVPVHDFSSLLNLLRGDQFAERAFSFSMTEVWRERIPLVAGLLFREFSLVSIAALWGFRTMRDRALRTGLVLLLALDVVWVLNYDIPDVEAHLLPGLLVVAILATVGLQDLLRLPRLRDRRWASLVLFALPLALFLGNHPRVDQSRNTERADQIEAMLAAVDRDAVILSPDYDWSAALWYYLLGEGWADRNLHLLHEHRVPDLVEYLVRCRPLPVPARRKYIPPGLRVFCFTRWQAEELALAGFRVAPHRAGLVEILAPSRPSDAAGGGR